MTRKCATDLHLAWMDGYYCGARMKRSSIAQSIRDAAINWPSDFLGNVECEIIEAFTDVSDEENWAYWMQCSGFKWATKEVLQSRTFMLLVAEALE